MWTSLYGEPGRSVKIRFSEHEHCLITDLFSKSAVIEHQHDTGHQIIFKTTSPPPLQMEIEIELSSPVYLLQSLVFLLLRQLIARLRYVNWLSRCINATEVTVKVWRLGWFRYCALNLLFSSLRKFTLWYVKSFCYHALTSNLLFTNFYFINSFLFSYLFLKKTHITAQLTSKTCNLFNMIRSKSEKHISFSIYKLLHF